jgi:hypothetical protein
MMASMLMWIMVQVTFTMHLYLCCLSRLTMSFLSSNEQGHQAYPLVKVKTTNEVLWRQTHLIIGRTCSLMPAFDTCGIICFAFYFLFCKGLEMMGSDKICTASCTDVHVLSLCHLYSFTIYLKNHKCELPKGYFSHALFSQLYT